ncbi:MAG TPA: N-acetylglucosamine-6-phosphate deacetylase [Pyrinomonadaceae bacterium]|nr:N-acetylglucosamine-6-phosphate deacetylase [Pyrinomonadaceae bacterium]
MTAQVKDRFVLENARLVLPERLVEQGTLVIEKGRIADIAERAGDFDGEKIDLDGMTLLPGFIDVHIHGAVGVDTLAAGPDDLLLVGEYLCNQGVTAWLPTLVPASVEEYQHALESISAVMSRQLTNTSRVLGVHYEGPFVSSLQCGALHRQHFRSFKNRTELDSLPRLQGADAIHMMTLAPEIEGGIDLVGELTKRGWISSIGHTRADPELLDQAHEAGARHMTHFMNAMPQLHHRKPGPVGWGLARNDVTCDVIADGVHLDPFVLRLLAQLKSPQQLALISDAIAAAGQGDGDYEIWGETIAVRDGRTQNAQGSIAGSVISMLDAVRVMRSLGVSEVEVATMASTNPARLLKIDGDCGSIEAGKRADLVALDGDGKVRFTMVSGRVVRSEFEI